MLTEREKQDITGWRKTYSIYSPWSDPLLFHNVISSLAEPFYDANIDKVLGIEAKGFVLAAPVAYELHTGLVVARKKGRLFGENIHIDRVISEECLDYTKTTKVLEIEKHDKGIQAGERVLIIDDWFETGGQGQAAVRLVQRAGGVVAGMGIMLDQMTEEIRAKFSAYNLHSLVYLKPWRRDISTPKQ